MRFGIFLKLFLAILAACIVVALAMGSALRWSFERGFLEYQREREQQRLTTLAALLEADYAEHGDWRALREDPRRWGRLLRASLHPPPPGGTARPPGPPPPADAPPGPGGPLPRTVLLDAGGALVAGQSDPNAPPAMRHPLRVAGAVVGWLATPVLAPPPANEEADRRFDRQQQRATWSIAALSILVAALVSALLARLLLRPVRRIAHATHQLAAGRYDTRVRPGAADELGLLARDFNRLADTLQRNEQLRRALTADISHELRTPLAVLRGEIEALQDGLRAPTPETLASLNHEVVLLSKLIDDLYELSLADVGALSYRMAPVAVVPLVRRCVAAHAERAGQQGLDLSLRADDAPPLYVQADAHRLDQVLNNLLENSLRYTDAPGRVEVRIEPERDAVRIVVQDSAPGVPAALQPRLFDRLFRIDASRNRASGGAGLGLALCARIADAHHGTLHADDSPLGGLRMTLRLPLGRPPSPADTDTP